ncbi:MAG TPA: selenocysteine-specific translation elongation factor [Bacteroidales bacterium]|nr:selenocysteine-specific translation elongation factor [Bacteroidales bacterium]HPS16492.1 selenocysteine-specific translation elongation factor [Bacteroidales bacterium]
MKHLIMGTAGHVDHGKTSLIKALTNIDCDTHKEEKRRGITINLGFSYLNLPKGESIGIIDVPGHKDFINTMVGGACGIDFVLLVIAADSGIMPQTIEHLNIINALGIKKGIVALTKIDLVDEELAEIAKYEIMEFLEKTSLKNASIVGVSSVTGQGKDELISAIEKIIADVEEKDKGDLFRLYIDRIFNVKGFGNVVTGSVLNGSVEVGSDVFLLPGNYPKLRVRSIERHGNAVERVVAGDRAAINLIGLKKEDFIRGMIISNKSLKETMMVDACISLFDAEAELSTWSNITFHTGTFECQARMHMLDKDSIKQNEEAIVQIHFTKPTILVNKDKFIIRNSSEDKTLGGGYIIDVSPLHHKKRTPTLIESLSHLSTNILDEHSINNVINIELKKEFRPFAPEEIAERLHMITEQVIFEIQNKPFSFKVYNSNESLILIDSNYNNAFKEKIIKALKEYHKENPIFPDGLEPNEIIGKLGLSKIKLGKTFLELLLSEMEKEGSIEKNKNTWIIKGHQALLDNKVKEEINWLENEILKYELQKPVMSEIEEKSVIQKISKHDLKMYLSYLIREGKIYFYNNEIIHSSFVNKFRTLLLKELVNKENGIEVNEFKTKMNATKRFCLLLVDIFEAEKIISKKGLEINTIINITKAGEKKLNESLS